MLTVKVMLRLFVAFILVASFASLVRGSETERLQAFFEKVFEDELIRSPVLQSYMGIKTGYDQWDDISDGAARREYLINTQLLTTLRTEFDYAKLSEQDELSYRLFELRCERAIADFPWRFHSYPIEQMFGWQSRIPAFLINIHRVSSVSDAEAYIARLQGVRTLISQVVENLDSRSQKGIVIPRFVFPLVLQDCQNLLTGRPFEDTDTDCTLLADFQQKVNSLENITAKKRIDCCGKPRRR